VARCQLLPEPQSDKGINPLNIAGSGDCSTSGQNQPCGIERGRQTKIDVNVLTPIPRAGQQIDGGPPGEEVPLANLVSNAGLDDRFSNVNVARHVERQTVEGSRAIGADTERRINNVAVQRKRPIPHLGVAHPRDAIDMLQNPERADADVCRAAVVRALAG
jgi:hypothetical protein